MILTDKGILEQIRKGKIVISPYRRECLGTNSYDIHLSKYMEVYGKFNESITDYILSNNSDSYFIKKVQDYLSCEPLDAKKENSVTEFEIPKSGILLVPGVLYLGSTLEYTETHAHVPFLEGKSSMGRLGIDIHATAGKGDVGFCNHWTLEISCIQPVRIYAGMPVGQMIYFETGGDIENYYHKKSDAKYNQRSPKPAGSAMWKNWIESEKRWK
jgi:dCTP deaminase